MEHATLVPSHSRGPEQDGMSYRAGFSDTSVAIITPTRSGAVAAPARVRFLTPSFARVRAHSTGGPCDSGFLSRTCFRGASCSRSQFTGIPGSLTSACSGSPFPRVHPSTHISHILKSCRMRRLLALSAWMWAVSWRIMAARSANCWASSAVMVAVGMENGMVESERGRSRSRRCWCGCFVDY